MPGRKKSRKVGKIGTPKTTSNIRKPSEKRVKKALGKPAGSRNNEHLTTQGSSSKKVMKDPRHGSKKPISLIVEEQPKQPIVKVKHFSPKQELQSIEQDSRLSALLDKIDLGKALSREDQQYADQKLARHKELCEMLGVTNEPSEPAIEDEQQSDLYSQFEAIDINDFKD